MLPAADYHQGGGAQYQLQRFQPIAAKIDAYGSLHRAFAGDRSIAIFVELDEHRRALQGKGIWNDLRDHQRDPRAETAGRRACPLHGRDGRFYGCRDHRDTEPLGLLGAGPGRVYRCGYQNLLDGE